MFASVRGTRIYFDVEGMGLVPDGPTMRERPVAMVIHGGPGGDHSGFKPGFTPLSARMQLVYFDHRGRAGQTPPTPQPIHSTKMSRTWRRCVGTWVWGQSSLSAHHMVGWWRWRMPRATRTRSRTWC